MKALGISAGDLMASVAPGPGDLLAALAALGLDALRWLDRFELFLLLLLVSAMAYGQAAFLQQRWVAVLASGGERVPLARLELGSTLPWLFLRLLTWPLRATYRGLRGLYRWISDWLHRRRGENTVEETAAGEEGVGEVDPEPARPVADPPLLVATLGPSFALAALATGALYLVALGLAPAVAASLGLPRDTPGAWERLLLGSRPELGGWSIADSPFQAASLVALALWLPIWSTLARLIRLVHGRSLGRNLVAERERPETLELWRRAFATRCLVAPSEPYRQWAVPLVTLALIGLGGAWFLLGSRGPRPADFAVAWIVCLGWVLHLRLRGEERQPVAAEPEAEPHEEPHPGWDEVLTDLRARLGVEAPVPLEPSREIPPLPAASGSAGSPLLTELVPGGSLLEMQRYELARLARIGGVAPPEGPSPGELSLEETRREESDPEPDDNGHRIVLAPEGWGASTLGFLAAVDQALSHARSSLIVVRGEEEARVFEERFRSRLAASTLRWNVQFRRLGGDLAMDQTRGVEPDVLVCDLHGLVLDLLAHRERHGAFLRRLGLVVIDGAEAFSGPVEIHAQLAFRRLRLALAHTRGHELGDEPGEAGSVVRFLVTSRETLFRADRWLHDLCSLEASVGRHGPEGLWGSAQRAESDEETKAEESKAELPSPAAQGLRSQELFRLQDLVAASGRALSPGQLVESCERSGVPWHYRNCREVGAGMQELGALDLPEHPRFRVGAAEAAVLLLAGPWSLVRRELGVLRRAGSEHRGTGAVALLTLCDRDEERAFDLDDLAPSLRGWVDRLPLPILRSPSGATLDAHLWADLLQGWNELGELVEVYGPEIGDRLRGLARRDLLLAEAGTEVDPARRAFVEQLRVRALQEREAEANGSLERTPRIEQVELRGARPTRIVDRSTRVGLGRIEPDSAHLAMYPGRIFDTRNGRYVVAETEAWGRSTAGPDRLWAEPVLVSEVSSPRRRIRARISAMDAQESLPRPELLFFGEAPVAVRRVRAEVSSEHFATLRIEPASGEVRRKHEVRPGEGRRASWRLVTEALELYAAPLGEEAEGGPGLSLAGARLIAAALRLVLPSLYRGGAEALAVGLCLEGEPAAADTRLGPGDTFLFFDLGDGGTGAARALRRDGLKLLLRLVRRVLERLEDHRRLLALYDEWADSENLWGAGIDDEGKDAGRESERRRDALAWLDSRLRPEGEVST